MFSIRLAANSDVDSICEFDHIAQQDKQPSTNLSNLPMQSLLAKLGYTLSGVIHHLDEDDPELVYVKCLKQNAG